MVFNGQEIEFPVIGKISFHSVFESLEKRTKDEDPFISKTASNFLKEVSAFPELREGIEVKDYKKYREPLDKLARIMFPDVLTTNEIKALTPPFAFDALYSSDRFKNIFGSAGQRIQEYFMEVEPDKFYKFCCHFILASYYGYPTHGGGPMIIEIFNKKLGVHRSYQMAINADLTQFTPTEKAVDITEEDFHMLVNNDSDISLWKEKFPPDSWIMRGVNILNLMDVTDSQSLSKITSSLLVKSEQSILNMKEGLKSLFNDKDLQSGVVIFKDGNLQQIHSDEMKSIILRGSSSMDCSDSLCEYSEGKLMTNSEPMILPDVSTFHKKSKSKLSQSLVDQKIGSYMMIPLVYEEEMLGFMELGSKQAYKLNSVSLHKLQPLIPIVAMAMKRFQNEEQNLVEAVIQQECTTIHESVKWKFEEEAKKFLQNRFAGNQPVFTDIVFDNVVPLFGQLDIKGSSNRRNEAIKADLMAQIISIRKILKKAQVATSMDVYEELLFRVDGFKKRLTGGLTSGIDHEFTKFVEAHIDPAFKHLATQDKSIGKLVSVYEATLDPEIRSVYEQRKIYDESVNKINHVLAAALDKKQDEAQKIFPHYYERYKTDGVEYNMYIGQSMAKDDTFDPIYLRNLRIWQLSTMWSLENDFKALSLELGIDVEIASMILAYSTPLSVHFRIDEKRFDVEGAYNARYEIVKSRIDKAHIKGTTERIRQPGKMTIVYAQQQDAVEYHEYLEYLTAKGYFTGKIEDLELEDLQGVHGLRALRVGVNFKHKETGANVEEFLKTMEQLN